MANALHIFLLVIYLTLVSSTVQSLKLRMIHRDSVLSPLYPGNLTTEEQMRRLYNHTILRAQMIKSTMTSPAIGYNTTHVQPRVLAPYSNIYVLELVFGTPRHEQEPRRARYLMMDTASNVVWLQCQPCVHCWSPRRLVFDPRTSQSFAPIPCDHPLCDLRNPKYHCVNHQCRFVYMHTMQSTLAMGVLATETLSLASDQGGFESVHNFVFGCSYNSQSSSNLGVLVSGIAGFGTRATSFLSQMNQEQANGKFAYCLASDINHVGVLKLGEHAALHGPNIKRVPFVSVPSEMHYFVSLVDVSVADRRIGFLPGTFRARIENGVLKGGFIIDSGSACASFSSGGPYERISDTFVEYFRRFRLARDHHHYPSFEMCYRIPRRRGFKEYPSMTFHFENGNDFVVQPENMVLVDHHRRSFCVMILKIDLVNTLGAYQQRNYRMSFDIQSNTLSYTPANCGRDV